MGGLALSQGLRPPLPPTDLRLENVKEPAIKHPNDALVALTASAISGTDLPMIRGAMPGMRKGIILGHEGQMRISLPGQPTISLTCI